jgi:hypothetical protein
MKTERQRPNKIIAERNEVIRRIKAAFKKKDEEFDELMDIKIALAMELKAYRTMIETEEDRLGYKSPLKVRKMPNTPSFVAPSPRSTTTTTTTTTIEESKEEAFSSNYQASMSAVDSREEPSSSLLISGTDFEGQYIRIRNGGTEAVPLAGWSLRSHKKGTEFNFPESVRLRPGESFTVRTLHADNAEAKAKTESDSNSIGTVAWSKPHVWDETGDEAQLIDPSGEVIAHVDILPTQFKSPAKSAEESSGESLFVENEGQQQQQEEPTQPLMEERPKEGDDALMQQDTQNQPHQNGDGKKEQTCLVM